MANSEYKISPFDTNRSIKNTREMNLQPKDLIQNEENPNKIKNEQSESKSFLKAFLTSKKGIIILSIIGVIAVASIVVAVVVTKISSNKDNENDESIKIGNITSVEDDPFEFDAEDVSGLEEFILAKETKYTEPLLTLTQNNLIEYSYLGQKNRTVPTQVHYEKIATAFPTYGSSSNSLANAQYDLVLKENKQIMASSTTYDEMDEHGHLYLNGVATGKKIYKHVGSLNLYGGNISDDEKAVIKKIKINPISPTNYITGLYAPPGEVIKVEISEEDLANIGGELQFLIGQATQSNGYSENKESIGLKRMPILVNFMTIKKTHSYIGSFIGGPIYISNPPKRRIFTVTISNAVPYKHIIYGTTTKEEFEQMEEWTAPFFELDVRDSIRYSGPLQVGEGLDYDNLVQNLVFWDKCVRTSRKVPSGSNINLGIHFLFDPCVNANGAYALAYVGGNWCQVPLNFNMALNYETVTKYGAWGHIHELNHHFQRFGFSTGVQNEVTNNVVNLVEYILYSQISGLRNEFSDAAITTVSGNHRYLNPEHALNDIKNSPPSAGSNEIRFYEPILQTFGYDKFLEVTRYGNGEGGVDLFYRALTEVLKYDFTYYIENILNLAISSNVKAELQENNYPIFIPVSSIYQTGKYFNTESGEIFSNTSFPYRIPSGGPTKLNLDSHIIVPNGFTYEILEMTNPEYGTLQKLSDKVYTYTPDEAHKLSGIINMTVKVSNSNDNIETTVKLGLNFEIDNNQAVETDYIYDPQKYTSIFDAINANFEGSSSVNFYPNFNGKISGITEGNIAVWEGKFRIDDDGYKYILTRGGRGNSVLYIKRNDESDYTKVAEIDINQSAYMFTAKAHYQIDFNKGDIIFFKMYLLAQDTKGGSASTFIGISKTNVVSEVRTLGANDIVGLDREFDQKYVFYSGDPYKTDREFNSYSFFDYTLVELYSDNFEPWDNTGTYELKKMIDRLDNTYMHTKKNTKITSSNPLTLIFVLGKKYYFDYISIQQGGNNYYLPYKLIISISEDNTTWTNEGEYISEKVDSSAIIILNNKLYTRYIKLHIIETTDSSGYIGIKSIEFVEQGVKFYQKTPEYPVLGGTLGNIVINFDNFPYFGHSYILTKGNSFSFSIDDTSGIKIKVCNKFDSKISLTVDNNSAETININSVDELDFPIDKRGLMKGTHNFKIEVKDGKFDLEYILYQM